MSRSATGKRNNFINIILVKNKENEIYTPQGNTSTENNTRIKWGTVVKEHNKKPERDDI